MPDPSTLLTNARLSDGRVVDVHVAGGLITAVSNVEPGGSAGGDERDLVHDLNGWLLLPALAEPHAHLDKALTAEAVPNPTGDLMGAIKAWQAVRPNRNRSASTN